MMGKAFKLFAFAAASVLLFLIAVSLAFYHLVQIGEFRRFLIAKIEQSTELKAQLGDADLEMGAILGVAFRDVALSEPGSAQPAITGDRFTARVALMPLLKRRLVFTEVRLEKPVLRLVREPDGKFPLLERLRKLPFLQQQEGQFALDVRAIKIARGEVEFLDRASEKRPATTLLHNVELELTRPRDQALREIYHRLMRTKSDRPRGAALAFELHGEIERDSQRARVSVKGTMISPGVELDIQEAWWEVNARATDIPAAMIPLFAGDAFGAGSLRGTLGARFQMDGNPKQRVHLKGDIAFQRLALDAPEHFSAPLAPGDGQVEIELDWRAQQWDVQRLELRSQELRLGLRGAVRGADGVDPQLQLHVTSPFVPLAVIKNYLPAKWLAAAPLENLALLQGGELRVNKGEIEAKLSELSGLVEGGSNPRLSLDADVRGLGVNLPGGYPPLRGVQGHMILEKGSLALIDFKGEYSKSRLAAVEGSYRFAGPGAGTLRLRAKGEMDLDDLQEQWKKGLAPAAFGRAAAAIDDFGGKAKFDLAVSRAAESRPQVEGKIVLDGARLEIADIAFADIRGEVALSPSEIKVEKARALLFGSPVQIQLALKDYAEDKGGFDLYLESPGIKAGAVARMLLSKGSLQDPGMVRGSVRYRGALGAGEGRKLSGTLDLANVQLAMQPFLDPLKDLNGRVRIDETGIDFQNFKGSVAGFPASFNGRWRYAAKPQLLFEFAAPNLDLGYLLSRVDTESAEFYATLQGVGKVALSRGRFKGFEFTNLKTELVIDRRVWRLSNTTAQAAGGSIQGAATITDRPDRLGFSVEPKIQGVPVQSVHDWFEFGKVDMSGKVQLAGKFESFGRDGPERKRNLNGAFQLRIQDGTIGRMRILVQILNLLDLSRWFTFQMPDLGKQGIGFRSITADFKVSNGVYTTQDLLVDSDDLRISGAGKIDVPNDEIDFVVAVRPFAGIDTVINYIPLIGRGIAAIKNSFLVASFNVTGPIDNPTITPAPLSTVSEWFLGVLGIPKSIIGLGEEKKDNKEPVKEQNPAPDK